MARLRWADLALIGETLMRVLWESFPRRFTVLGPVILASLGTSSHLVLLTSCS